MFCESFCFLLNVGTGSESVGCVEQLAEHCAQLIELDGPSKWPLLLLLRLALLARSNPLLHKIKFAQSVDEMTDTLVRIDPFRKEYYKSLTPK